MRSSPNARSPSCPTCRRVSQPHDFSAPAVIGAGTMGGGIAMAFADFGYDVKIIDATQEALDRGMDRIRNNYATSVKRGSLAEDEMNRRLARIEPVAGYDDIADRDVIVEAVFEEMDVKKPIFAKLDEVMHPDALLFSNTSALDIDQLAAMTKRPQNVAGTHFFSPANVMKLLEVVRGAESSPETLFTAMALGRRSARSRRWRATPMVSSPTVRARRSTAKWSSCWRKAACRSRSTRSWSISAIRWDRSRWAILPGSISARKAGKRRAAANPNYRKLPIADKLVELGRYGQKTGAGWYRYEKGDRTPHPDPEVAAIIKACRRRDGRAAEDIHRYRNPASAAVFLGQRSLPHPRGGQSLPRQRHRRDVAARLWLSALSRRSDVLGRWHRREERLQPNRILAPAIRRALGAVTFAAGAGRDKYSVP